nr:FHA domain-containing protein [Arthrospira sp. PLM2.Bin9]
MAELTLEWVEEGRLNSTSIRANQPSKHPGVFRIGRDGSRCDLVCVDQTVSGLHIEIFFSPENHQFYLRSLRESNPPIVDGKLLPVGEEPLNNGSHIQLGNIDFKVTAIAAGTQPVSGGLELPPPPPEPPPPPPVSPVKKALPWLGGVVLMIGLGWGGFWVYKWQAAAPIRNAIAEAEQARNQGESYHQQGNMVASQESYETCKTALTIEPTTTGMTPVLKSELTRLLKSCEDGHAAVLMKQANSLAEAGSWRGAIDMALQVPENTSSYSEAQNFFKQASQRMEELAQEQYRQGNYQQAVKIAEAIPETSPNAARVKQELSQWEQEWNRNENHLENARQSLNREAWREAIAETERVALLGESPRQDSEYWKQKVQPIIDRANDQKREEERRIAEQQRQERLNAEAAEARRIAEEAKREAEAAKREAEAAKQEAQRQTNQPQPQPQPQQRPPPPPTHTPPPAPQAAPPRIRR